MGDSDDLKYLKSELEMCFQGVGGMLERGEVSSTNVQVLRISIAQARRQRSRELRGLTPSPSYDVLERIGQKILDVLADADANAPDHMLELEALVDERLNVGD